MRLTCPVATCRTDNDVQAEVCVHCGTPLRAYTRLSTYPAHLFNQGLSEARKGKTAHARDLFAAVVYWCPMDLEARNALAMACYISGDSAEARRQWEMVLSRSPTDPLATGGLAALTGATKVAKPRETNASVHHSKPHSRKKPERSKKRR